MAVSEQLREIVQNHMVPEAPIAQALLGIADSIDTHERAFGALTERIEELEDRPFAGASSAASGPTA